MIKMAQLYMLLVGCSPQGRNTEQHDVFFGIGERIDELIPSVRNFWPEAGKSLHIDAWRTVSNVDGYTIEVVEREIADPPSGSPKLFFINLGGYKEGEFDEFHYKLLIVAGEKGEAVKTAKKSAFFKHTSVKKAPAHIDDKYGIDVDDFHEIGEVLPEHIKSKYSIIVSTDINPTPDEINLGYFKLSSFKV